MYVYKKMVLYFTILSSLQFDIYVYICHAHLENSPLVSGKFRKVSQSKILAEDERYNVVDIVCNTQS